MAHPAKAIGLFAGAIRCGRAAAVKGQTDCGRRAASAVRSAANWLSAGWRRACQDSRGRRNRAYAAVLDRADNGCMHPGQRAFCDCCISIVFTQCFLNMLLFVCVISVPGAFWILFSQCFKTVSRIAASKFCYLVNVSKTFSLGKSGCIFRTAAPGGMPSPFGSGCDRGGARCFRVMCRGREQEGNFAHSRENKVGDKQKSASQTAGIRQWDADLAWSWQQESNLQPADYKFRIPGFVLFCVAHYYAIIRLYLCCVVWRRLSVFCTVVDQKLTIPAPAGRSHERRCVSILDTSRRV